MKSIIYDGWELEFFDKANNFRNYQFDLLKKDLKGCIAEIGPGNGIFLDRYKSLVNEIHLYEPSLNFIKNLESKKINNIKIFNSNFFEKPNYYDIIIDTNLKSFSCCQYAFDNLMKIYSSILSNNGFIISSFKGMNWSRIIKPIYSFSLSKLFYKRLKEFDGPISNILSFNECKKVCSINNLDLTYFEGLIILSKQ